MQLTAPRARTLAQFSAAARVTPTRTTAEILKNVLLRAWQGQWQFVASDSEISITLPLGVGCDNDRTDAVLLPNHLTASVLSECTADDISVGFDRDAGMCRFGWDGNWIDLCSPDIADFAQHLVAVDAKANWSVSCRDLKRAFGRTVYASDVDSTRYVMKGVAIEEDAGRLMCVATDSRRLATCAISCRSIRPPCVAPAVVPSKAASLLAAILPESDDEVSLAVTANTFRCTWPSGELAGRLQDGRFPQWRKVIPQHGEYEIEVVAGPLARAVRSIRATSEEGKVTLKTKTSTLVVSGQADNLSGTVEVPVTAKAGLTAMFDSKWLTDFLRHVPDTTPLTILADDADSAIVILDGDSNRYVVMPLTPGA